MPEQLVTRVVHDLLHLAQVGGAGEVSDRTLLDRFGHECDQAAFELLVRRHAGMVLAACRQVLHHEQDAEDAFQATFLVLARKGPTGLRGDSAAGWLFRVARRTAGRLKKQRPATQPLDEVAAGESAGDRELREVLEEELLSLPEHYRIPLLLCGIEGCSRQEAARRLGCPAGTLKIRLERGRALLRARLVRRGLSATALASFLASPVEAAAPAWLVSLTVRTARVFARDESLPTTTAIHLARGVLHTMLIEKTRVPVLLAGLFLALLMLSAGLMARPDAGSAISTHEERAQLARPQPAPRVPAGKPAIDRPMRILLFTGGPMREFQFLRSLLVRESDRNNVELSVLDQAGGAVHDVPPQRNLQSWPPFKANDGKPELSRFDIIVAVDPDWSVLKAEELVDLERWVREGGQLVYQAGFVNAAAPLAVTARKRCQTFLDLLPVELEDHRVAVNHTTKEPRRLTFTPPAANHGFLGLEDDKPLSGWEGFFTGGAKGEEKKLLRGFFSSYPTPRAKKTATVLAKIEVPAAEENKLPVSEPALALHAYGKGKVVYLSISDLWRLRMYRTVYHENLWLGMLRTSRAGRP
ncbi:MAG: RNA polymerase sigma factor [Gemmataceae bacterium]